MSSIKKVKRLFAQSDVTVSKKVDDRIIDDALTALVESKKPSQVRPESDIWRIIIKSSFTKIAAAVIVSVAVLTYCFYGELDGTSIAFGEVQNAVEKKHLVHRILRTNRNGKNYHTENWYYFDSRKVLSKFSAEGKIFKISSLNYNTMENVVYDPNSDIVTVLYRTDVSSDYVPYSSWSLVENCIKIFEQQGVSIDHKKGKYEARDVDIYNFTIPRNFRGEKVFAALTVDRDTHLPVIFKRRAWTQQGNLTLNQTINFNFPEKGPKDIYDIGVPRNTKVIHDLDSNKLLERKRKLLAEKPVCEKQFYESPIYRLDEGQMLKFIPPSLMGPRIKLDQINKLLLQLKEINSQKDMNAGAEVDIVDNYMYRLFYFDEEITSNYGPIFRGGVSLEEAFERIIGLSKFEYEISDGLHDIKIQGDWIVRTGASKRELLNAFEKIVQDYSKRQIRFVEQHIERNVIIARGTFRFNPLHETYDNSAVHVFSDKIDPDERGGGGSGSLDKFLRNLGDILLDEQIINETKDSEDIEVSYRWHYSGYLRKIKNDTERNQKMKILLDVLSFQTGLEFKRERRNVSKWIVTEQNN